MGLRVFPLAVVSALALTIAPGALAVRARGSEVAPPTVQGPLYKGGVLRCSVEPGVTVTSFAWLREGVPLVGANDETYVVTGPDVGQHLACTATTTENGVSATTMSAAVEIALVVTAIGDRSTQVQRGPSLKIHGQVSSEGPPAEGEILLVALGRTRDVVVARTPIDADGRYALTRTIRGLVPGRASFRVDFVPADRELHTSAEQLVTLRTLSPVTYPFARVAADRRVSFSDGLVPFWSDGSPCAVGCRPSGARPGWPLKPFHEQHALRAGLNERRLSGSHVGIDIMTSRHQPIYAIQSGYAHVLHRGDSAARVRVGNYIYWHVNLRVRDGQYVHAYDTLLGYSLLWMRHLHLSEVSGSDTSYLNPLRPGGRVLAPYTDAEPPVIGLPKISPDGSAVVEVFDPQSFAPRVFNETPVLAPAAVAYRLFNGEGAAIGRLEWALRGSRWIPNELAATVFASSAHSPGFFCFARNVVCRPLWLYRLAGGLAPLLPLSALHGRVRLTTYAWDWAGNVTARDTWIRR